MGAEKKRIVIIDDHPLFREGLKAILLDHPLFAVAGEAGCCEEGLKLTRKVRPELVILDISLPDGSGIQLTGDIHRLDPDIRILIVSVHSRQEHIIQAFRAGATGYMIKDSAAANLIHGLETIAEGEYFLDSPVTRQMVQRMINNGPPSVGWEEYERLTPREQQVFRFVVEGMTSRDISENLELSPKTIENHRARVMKKLKANNTVDLVRYAIRLGLIDSDSL